MNVGGTLEKLTLIVSNNIFLLIDYSVDGALDGWGDWFHTSNVYHDICGTAAVRQYGSCTAPKNGGIPCKELRNKKMPKRIQYGPKYRCDCKIGESFIIKVPSLIL